MNELRETQKQLIEDIDKTELKEIVKIMFELERWDPTGTGHLYKCICG